MHHRMSQIRLQCDQWRQHSHHGGGSVLRICFRILSDSENSLVHSMAKSNDVPQNLALCEYLQMLNATWRLPVTDMNICVLYVAWNYIICYPWETATFRLLFKLIWILSTFVFHRRDPHFLHYWLFARENPWSSRWIHHKESIMRSRDGFFFFFWLEQADG